MLQPKYYKFKGEQVKKKKKVGFYTLLFTTLQSSLQSLSLSPQQTPCEVGGAERALTELPWKKSSKSTVSTPRSPSWLGVEEN